MNIFKKIVLKTFKYNLLWAKLASSFDAKLRRKRRIKWLTDNIDPYFIMRKNQNKFNPILNNKFEMKKKVSDIVKTPETLFEIKKDGTTSNKMINNSLVILKHSNGGGNKSTLIINTNELNKKRLKKIYSNWELSGKYEGTFKGLFYAFKNNHKVYAEKLLDKNITDYKVYLFADDNYRFFIAKDRMKNQLLKATYDQNWKEVPQEEYGDMSGIELSKEEKEIFKNCLIKAKEISKKFNIFGRFDFYWIKDEIFLGEITQDFSNGNVFRKQQSLEVNDEVKWFYKNMLNSYKKMQLKK